MIKLKRKEEIEIYQVELALKVKTKQSPFIAILMLALEQGQITIELLQENLLTSLPLRACDNLLKRLEKQGYLSLRQAYNGASYSLTELGKKSAVDKSFWIGEKGVYNVFVTKSPLIQQRIIRTEKVEKAENDKDNSTLSTPKEISQYQNQILSINKTEILIEEVEGKCFKLKPADCSLELLIHENESNLKILKENQLLFQTDLDLEESFLQDILLTNNQELEYHPDQKVVLISFDKQNLSFRRKVRIINPTFKQVSFDPLDIDNIEHIPVDELNASLWYEELLFSNINSYYLDEITFSEFAQEVAAPILPYYKINIPKRKELAELFSERKDAFYQIAKLEAIDYLNFQE